MQRQNIIRTVLFAVFFGIGVASLGCSLLCDDIATYYRNKQFLKAAQKYQEKLQALNTDYDMLLGRLENDPNLMKRIAYATLNIEPNDANTIYPKPTREQLAAARKVLEKDPIQNKGVQEMPKWLKRCSEPRHRIILFLAGAGLILTSFTCFAPAAGKTQNLNLPKDDQTNPVSDPDSNGTS